MKKLNEMTNEEFLSHQVNYSKYGMMSTIVLFECIQKGVDEVLENKEAYLKEAEEDEKNGKISLVHVPTFIKAVEELNERLQQRCIPVEYKYDEEGNRI
jgi:hypothetical protein